MAKRKKDDHKKLIKKKRQIEPPCGLCKVFWNSHHRVKEGSTRYCSVCKRNIDFYSESCSEFELNNLFFCEKHYFQCSPEVCIARITKKYTYNIRFEYCDNCSLGWDILLYISPIKLQINFKGD
jgi:hypothetical protein